MSALQIPGFRALPLKISQLSLPAVLKCGQSFRWQSIALPSTSPGDALPTQEWRLTLSDRVVCLRQTQSTLFYRALFAPGASSDGEDDSDTLAWIRDYFQLDIDLDQLYEDWSGRDPVFRSIKDRFGGIRMLRQDPWENVISFICSQNNHISRISSMVQNLCINFSPQLLSHPSSENGAFNYHPFPPPFALSHPSTENKLRQLGFGYRAKYIQKTAAMLCETYPVPEKWLASLRELGVDAAREELLKLHGVGPKVADCILLMSLNKASVVPVDTHVYQIAVKHYGFKGKSGKPTAMTAKLYGEVAKRLTDVWGEYAGWAHSVLFTADLRSFANYGLPSPSPSLADDTTASPPSSASTPGQKGLKRSFPNLPTPSTTPSKRSRTGLTTMTSTTEIEHLAAKAEISGIEDHSQATTLAERIKSRRRFARNPSYAS